ncbi:MAG: DNA repair protein RecO [Chitinophagales bacterium]
MLHNTKGVVLKTFKYSETSVIAKVYTHQFGIQSYMVNGVRSSGKNKQKAALLQPLTLLEMVVYYRKNRNIQRIKEMKPIHTFTSIPFHIGKSSLALFTTELLYNTLKEEEQNERQFDFIFDFVKTLDETEESIANLHLYFLLQLSGFLGFYPFNNYSLESQNIFDLQEGVFTSKRPTHPYYLQNPLCHHFAALLNVPLGNVHLIKIGKAHRKELLTAFLQFYKLHIEGFKPLQSVKILQEVFGF